MNAARKVDAWLARLGRLLLPLRCLVCGEPGAAGLDLCAACRQNLPWNRCACPRCALPLAAPAPACGHCLAASPVFSHCHASFVYRFPVDRLLPRLKFHGDLAAGRLLADLAWPGLAVLDRPDALVPVPLHRRRLRQRGYDQAGELAKAWAQVGGLSLRDDLLRRRRATAAQSELDAEARQRNIRGAFSLSPCALPDHVVLVDDVMTTGATLRECAKVLLRAGVRRVDAWVLARAPMRRA